MPAVDGDRYGTRAADYAHHRADFPAAAVDRLVGLGVGRSGQRLLDLGCGTGTLARQFAARGCVVTGLDVDGRMLEAAEALAAADGVEVAWHLASAEDTGLTDGSFDVASAAQCWHWFDGAAAAIEACRLLVPAGLLAITNFDWLPLPGSVSGETEALIQAHHPAYVLGGTREPLPEAITQVEEAGFTVIETWVEDVDVPYLADSWRRRSGASAAIVNLGPAGAAAFEGRTEGLCASLCLCLRTGLRTTPGTGGGGSDVDIVRLPNEVMKVAWRCVWMRGRWHTGGAREGDGPSAHRSQGDHTTERREQVLPARGLRHRRPAQLRRLRLRRTDPRCFRRADPRRGPAAGAVQEQVP